MKEQLETVYLAETFYLWRATKPAKRLLGIAADRYVGFRSNETRMFLDTFSVGQMGALRYFATGSRFSQILYG